MIVTRDTPHLDIPFTRIKHPSHWNTVLELEKKCVSYICVRMYVYTIIYMYRCADKSLVRPGRKQATATQDFDVHISYLLS